MKPLRALLLLLLIAPRITGAWNDPVSRVPALPYTVAQKLPHDATLFTQGVIVHEGQLIESGGTYGKSRLVVRGFDSPQPLQTVTLPKRWFAEGIAVHGGRLFLLTWRKGMAQAYSLPALQPLQSFRYRGEGWGLTSDGRQLIQSDGSDELVWRDPVDFRATRRLEVTVAGTALSQLNELEYVHGWVLANVWLSDWIVGIDPRDGRVGWSLNLKGLLDKREKRAADIANGIAWDPQRKLLWVTGKDWPWLFGLRVEMPPLP